MPGNESSLKPLLKYPAILGTLLVGMFATALMFGIDYSRVTKIGPGGVELDAVREETVVALAALSEQVEALSARVEQAEANPMDYLASWQDESDGGGEDFIGDGGEDDSADGKPQDPPVGERDVIRAKSLDMITHQTATVSDNIARLSKSWDNEGTTLLKGKTGYIWIGDFNTKEGKWANAQLTNIGRDPGLDLAPNEMQVGTKFRVKGNVVLRGSLPANDAKYFRGQENLGVIPSGTVVTLAAAPGGIDRSQFNARLKDSGSLDIQYWVRVRVEQ